jgi:hypothetical protein
MKYIIDEGLRTPKEFIRPEILALLEPSGIAERVLQGHTMLLSGLLDNQRLGRLATLEALAPASGKPYTMSEMLTDLRAGVWSELKGPRVNADLYRRNLQRAYLAVMDAKLNPPPFVPPTGLPSFIRIMPPPPLSGEGKAMVRQELTDLDAQIAKAIPAAASREMKAHLLDARDRISKTLNPEKK